jgi:cell division protein FtsQ
MEGARFRRSPAAAVVLTVMVLGLGGWTVTNSPMFRIGHIEVRGAVRVPAADVIGAAAVGEGHNLIRLSMDDVAARIERLSWVIDAVAARDLPSTLVIEVVERTPAAWLPEEQGGAIVARDGTVVERTAATPRRILPMVDGVPVGAVGEALRPLPPQVSVVASMGRELRARIGSAAWADDEVVLELRGGGTVRYGPATRSRAKNHALTGLLRWAHREGVAVGTIDLRVPDAPTLEPAGRGGAGSPSSP